MAYSTKRKMLKHIVRGKVIGKTPTGASSFKLDNGLGVTPLTPSKVTGGNGSNMGLRRVF